MNLSFSLVWGFVFFIFSFLLSLFLSLISGISFYLSSERAFFSGILGVIVSFVVKIIYKTYLSQHLDLSLLFSQNIRENSELSEKNIIDDFKKEEISNRREEDELKNTALSSNALNLESDPIFSQVVKDIDLNRGMDAGLQKVTQDTFSTEDPAVMADAIKSIMMSHKDSESEKEKG